jgi:hypothetical protein
MATFNRYEKFSENLCAGVHNLGAANNVLKVALTNTAPNLATHTVLADITEIAGGNGYTAGGTDTQNAISRTGAVTSITGVDITWTAAGGTIGPFRYAVLYDDTPASPAKPLIGNWDYGAAVTLAIGESFVVDFTTSMFSVG